MQSLFELHACSSTATLPALALMPPEPALAVAPPAPAVGGEPAAPATVDSTTVPPQATVTHSSSGARHKRRRMPQL